MGNATAVAGAVFVLAIPLIIAGGASKLRKRSFCDRGG